MKRLRISAISYLNTAPLMWNFEHGAAAADFDISYTIPSRCARQLEQGSADIGIIPAAAYAHIPDLALVPGVAIAARRAVASILLVSKLPLEEIQTVALDASSLTSVALVKVLFAKYWGGERRFTAMDPDIGNMLSAHDAALIIGDPALQIDGSGYVVYDLAEQWVQLTGKPFVFAFWAIRRSALEAEPNPQEISEIFQQSREEGLKPDHLDAISRSWSVRLGVDARRVRRYLTENIHYYLDAPCLDGLQLFYRYAEECGVLAAAPQLRFLAAHPVLC
jgi:chorismate dehydratase